ncbi:MAG: hypothetical protein ACTHU0_25295 [Kofleriaceae bacterium]
MLFVIRDEIELSRSGLECLESLTGFLVGRRRARTWPGTVLLGGFATVYEFVVASDVIEVVGQSVSGLFAWKQPARPEDLCFLRADRSVWLASIAHEHDAFLNLRSGEAVALRAECPRLWGLLDHEGETAEEIVYGEEAG